MHRPPHRSLNARLARHLVRPTAIALLALASLAGCEGSTSESSSSTMMPRPAAPAAIDQIARGEIEKKADQLAATPDSKARWMSYGDVCLMNLWPEEAVVAYRHVLSGEDSLDPVLAAKVRWRLAHALHDVGDAEAAETEAVASLTALAEAENGIIFGDGWVTVAGWRLDQGDMEGVDAALANAKRARPIRRAIVSVQNDIQQGRNDAARDTVDDLLAKGVTDRTLNRLAVMVGQAQGDPMLVANHEANAAESLTVMDDSIIAELTPLARHERADLLRCLNFRAMLPPQAAFQQVGPYVQARPKLAMLRVIEADLLRRLNAHAQAKEVLDKVYADDPPDHEYWATDAAVHLHLAGNGQPDLLDRARKSSDRAIEINPRIAYGWQIRALIHEQDGEWAEAGNAYRKAAEFAERPEDAERWRGDAMRCDAESIQP